jgi:hypothetical protein|uniref:Uncharacterized protein n=1 Tax=Myoviridae sp. ctCo31 TaxID=2825053 RepID=A0A8S5UMP1_9CAUD|nr:MAG TPA: hypothetical protein [Myoviridae sp. ctCo31]
MKKLLFALLVSMSVNAGVFSNDDQYNYYVLCKDQNKELILRARNKEDQTIKYDYYSDEFGFNEYYSGEFVEIINMKCVTIITDKKYKTNKLSDFFTTLEEVKSE